MSGLYTGRPEEAAQGWGASGGPDKSVRGGLMALDALAGALVLFVIIGVVYIIVTWDNDDLGD